MTRITKLSATTTKDSEPNLATEHMTSLKDRCVHCNESKGHKGRYFVVRGAKVAQMSNNGHVKKRHLLDAFVFQSSLAPRMEQ
jgi:hypothetical protein